MRNAGLDEAQAGIKIAGRNINNLRYVDVPCFFLLTGARLLSFSIQIWPHERKNYLKNSICKSNYSLHLRLCSEMEENNFQVPSTVCHELMPSGKPPILKTDKIIVGGTRWITVTITSATPSKITFLCQMKSFLWDYPSGRSLSMRTWCTVKTGKLPVLSELQDHRRRDWHEQKHRC